MRRRDAMYPALAAAAWLAGARPAGAAAPATLLAAWSTDDGRHHAGLLRLGARPEVLAALELPTRAHGVLAVAGEHGPEAVVMGRRPGAWWLRWRPGARGAAAVRWHWRPEDRRGCGHAIVDAAGRLLATETDLEHERGIVAVHDAAGRRVAEWPTGGIDPHALIADADGTLLVANGGVPTAPETGRSVLDRSAMDPSLVRLSPHDGARLGQWRLADPRLSVRHLARHASGVVGVALQAEHDDAAARAAAPLLALFDGRTLAPAADAGALAGYGGDIAADGPGFRLSATRAGRIVAFGADGRRRAEQALPEAGALTRDAAWSGGAPPQDADGRALPLPPGWRLDNHWARWSA